MMHHEDPAGYRPSEDVNKPARQLLDELWHDAYTVGGLGGNRLQSEYDLKKSALQVRLTLDSIEAQEAFNKKAEEYAKAQEAFSLKAEKSAEVMKQQGDEMIRLTLWIKGLTIALVVLTAVLIAKDFGWIGRQAEQQADTPKNATPKADNGLPSKGTGVGLPSRQDQAHPGT